MNWKKAAVRLARAIILFERNEWQRVHTDGIVSLASKILRARK